MNYQLSITKADLPYVIEAIGLRAATLQESLRMQARDIEEQERRKAEEARRAAMPDPLKPIEAIIEKAEQKMAEITPEETNKIRKAMVKTIAKPSLAERRETLQKMLADKMMKDWSTAAIARACGMSYVAVANARKKKGRK